MNRRAAVIIQRPCRRRSGMSLGELIIALAIASSVLVAAGAATNASFNAYQANQEQSGLMQRARLTMHRMLTSIRTGTGHLPDSTAQGTAFQQGLVVTDTGIEVDTEDGVTVVYRYDATNKRLMVEQAGQTARVLLEGVEQFSVKMEPMRSPVNTKAGLHYDRLKRATITFKIRSTDDTSLVYESTGKQSVTLSSAVVPRRNAW